MLKLSIKFIFDGSLLYRVFLNGTFNISPSVPKKLILINASFPIFFLNFLINKLINLNFYLTFT
jgi:hypothetical protein